MEKNKREIKIELETKCHDCSKEIKTNEKGEVIEAKCLKYNYNDKDIYVFKCNECYNKDKSLRNFQSCEVYSRVVGYYRPVQQWNKGKEQEYKDRKDFKQK